MEIAQRLLLACKLYNLTTTTTTLAAPFKLPFRIRPIKFPNLYHLHNKSDLGLLLLHRRAMSSSSSSSPIEVKEKIDLTEKEKQIFDRLLDVVRHFSQLDASFKQTQLRVAGGWVRDKLLGKECIDIDIALNNMLGREFCEKVNEYLSDKGEEKQRFGVIQCNPDQSKHLETARMRIDDIWVDFVNLRAESYSENSRIPTMMFGTAKEDAERRDLTINSLFYNINTNSVEDFTGRGVADLKSGKIVTPVDPMETFLDDPLRVLRAIRFGARFGFVLDEELKKAAASKAVKDAIVDKISRERIGHEIDLMISGNEPVKAMTYIYDLQLFWVIFTLPHQSECWKSEGCDRRCVAYIDAAWSLLQLVGSPTFSEEQRRLYLYGALFLPLRKFTYADNKAKMVPVVNHIIRNSLKLKSSDAETVMKLHVASDEWLTLIPSLTSTEIEQVEVQSERKSLHLPDTSRDRIVAGKLLREIKSFWRVSLLISILLSSSDSIHTGDFQKASIQLDKGRQLYKRIENTIMELGLDNVWDMKPLINGKEIMAILQLKTGGPQVKEWQKQTLKWQLAHPSGTAQECINWMREELEEQKNSKRAKLEPVSNINDREQDLVLEEKQG